MTADPDMPRDTDRAAGAGLTVTETGWGYVIGAVSGVRRRAALAERAAGFAGVAAICLAGGHWPLTQWLGAPGIGTQAALSAGVLLAGLAFLRIAARGFSREVQVDLEARCLRMASRNRKGAVRVTRRVAFDEVGNLILRRFGEGGSLAGLFLRVPGEEDMIEVARGDEVAMDRLRRRVLGDVHGPCRRRLVPIHRGRALAGVERGLIDAA